MRLVRNLARRKLRTALTVMGITIGIWALVVMSSLANKVSALVDGGSTYFKDKIIVTDKASPALGFGFTPMSLETADEIKRVPGVAVARAEIQMLVDPEGSSGGFGLPDFITGTVAGSDQGRETFELRATTGRLLTPEDEGANVVVLGADLARKLKKKTGNSMEIRGQEFSVVGVLEPTLTAPDTTALLPLEAAQRLMAEDLPSLFKGGLSTAQLASQIVVYPEAGTDIEALAATIEERLGTVQTLTGKEFDEEVGSSTAIFNAIILGVALISLVVGGLSVINTMTMSVAERTREIGIKRAIGASRARIMRELVSESGIIGLTGGIIGLALGAVVVVVANALGRSSGIVLFHLTVNTAIFALVFSTVLGMAAGLIPSWNAARLDPVEALRYE